MVKTKFKCNSINMRINVSDVYLVAVTTGNDESDKLSKNNAQLALSGVPNEIVAESFKPGQEYFIDITPAG